MRNRVEYIVTTVTTAKRIVRNKKGMVDRVIQQAIQQVLSPIYDSKFSETRYGFRLNRSTHDPLKKCKEYANEGYNYA